MKRERLLLGHIKRLYRDFYDKGGRQSDIVRETGLKQPTISRYMNGTIPLNNKFLTGFMRAIGKSMDDLTPYIVSNTILDVKYTASGKSISEKVEIMAMELPKTAFGIIVDVDRYGLRKGSILIVCDDIIPAELDNVVLIGGGNDAVIYGVLEYKPDMFDRGWAIRTQQDKNTVSYAEVTNPKDVLYVAGIQYPKNEGRKELVR